MNRTGQTASVRNDPCTAVISPTTSQSGTTTELASNPAVPSASSVLTNPNVSLPGYTPSLPDSQAASTIRCDAMPRRSSSCTDR